MTEFTMDRLRENLESLKMKNTLEILDNYLERAVAENLNIVDVLDHLFAEEAKSKRKRAYEKQIQMSGFPIQKTLDDFDFSFQPSINKRQINELATMRFLENGENVVFLGPPGVGKTHLASAILDRVLHHCTVMINYRLRDKTLFLKAKGLLSLMLSLPETWDYTLSGLARISLEGKDAIRTAVVELEKAGYIQRAQTTDKAEKFSGNEYIIREHPTQVPLSKKPATVSTQTGNTSPVFPTQINKEKQITDSLSKDSFPFPSTPPAPDVGLKEAKGRKHGRKNAVSKKEMDGYRELIRENICYDDFARERPYDVPQLDEMVEAVCSRKEAVRAAGNDLPQAVVKSRLLKPDGQHIRFVFDCPRRTPPRYGT